MCKVHAGLDTIYGKGMSDVLERDDFEEALMELDRRFFLLQVDLFHPIDYCCNGGKISGWE